MLEALSTVTVAVVELGLAVATTAPCSPPLERALSNEELDELFGLVDRVFLPKPVARYIARLVSATHPDGS
ncbi:MAG: hypothetical protein AAGD38_23905, partial [Acidobacteriota bacterium]